MQTLRDWLRVEPFALGMSAGFFGFFAHCGFLSILEEERLLPSHISGASAGALIGGLWASGLSTHAIKEQLFALQRKDFWDPSFGVGLLKGDLFSSLLHSLLPIKDFSECRAKLSVSIYDILSRKTLALQSGPLGPAIQASCTLPGLFQPLWVEGRPLWDGGIFDRPGLLGLSTHPRILHHHLSARSPWRKKDSVQVTKKPGLVSLVLEGLPRVGPFTLEVGKLAFASAQEATRRALSVPIQNNKVQLTAQEKYIR
jgi:NTE family protein